MSTPSLQVRGKALIPGKGSPGTVGSPDSGKQENMLLYHVCFCFLVGEQVTRPFISEPGRGRAGETPGSRLEQPLRIKVKSGLVEGPSSNMNLVNLMFTDFKSTVGEAVWDPQPCRCETACETLEQEPSGRLRLFYSTEKWLLPWLLVRKLTKPEG